MFMLVKCNVVRVVVNSVLEKEFRAVSGQGLPLRYNLWPTECAV